MANQTTFGERLRAARQARGLTIAALGKEAGVAPSGISRWETHARSGADAFKLAAVARALGVSLDHLLGLATVDTEDAYRRGYEDAIYAIERTTMRLRADLANG